MFNVILTILLTAWALRTVAQAQHPLGFAPESPRFQPKGINGKSPRKLHGRFLHITGLFVNSPSLTCTQTKVAQIYTLTSTTNPARPPTRTMHATEAQVLQDIWELQELIVIAR